MRPQFFPWLFDDKAAWEKSLADPRYTYELPIEHFMHLYTAERKAGASGQSSSAYFAPIMSAPPAAIPAPSNVFPSAANTLAVAASAMPAQAAPIQAKEEEKHEEGILSQDEIDALLSGL